MRLKLLLLCGALACLSILPGCDPVDLEVTPRPSQEEKHGITYLYDAEVIPEIHVTVPLAEWDSLLEAYDKNKNTKKQIHCDVVYVKGEEQTKVADAGLRLKGNTSRRRPEGSSGQKHSAFSASWHHCHYQINFHKYNKDDEHKVHGAEKVTLKWFKDDPAYVRELYCYDFFSRAGVWTGAHEVYCRLFIQVAGDPQETYLGVYGMIEPVDEDYLKVRKDSTRFGSADGYLWKCRYGATLASTSADFGADLDDDSEHVYELKTHVEELDAAKAQLKSFIRNLNTLKGDAFRKWIESVCDVPLLLRTYAANVGVGMWDDYWNNTNNYYIYFNSRDEGAYRFYFIPYDYDNTLGTCTSCGVQQDAGRQDPFNWGDSGKNPLIAKLLEIADYREMYRKYLLELAEGANGLLDAMASATRIRAWQASISPYVANDTGEDMKISDRPASWGNHGEYRLTDTGSADNYFRVKTSTIKQYCK